MCRDAIELSLNHLPSRFTHELVRGEVTVHGAVQLLCHGLAGCSQRHILRAAGRRRQMTHMPDHAQTVIIGGGIHGCSVAYHLAKAGWRDGSCLSVSS